MLILFVTLFIEFPDDSSKKKKAIFYCQGHLMLNNFTWKMSITTFVIQQKIFWLDISMSNAFLVQIFLQQTETRNCHFHLLFYLHLKFWHGQSKTTWENLKFLRVCQWANYKTEQQAKENGSMHLGLHSHMQAKRNTFLKMHTTPLISCRKNLWASACGIPTSGSKKE